MRPIIAGALAVVWNIGSAQVVLDGKFGTSGALTGPSYNIGASLGAIRGNNLFHSFSQFDLKAGDVANFTGPPNIQNILSRVTGGKPSSIDGTIRSGIAGANFYFINPSGVIFGPNASVDVSGAFAVSTANYLKLEDGAQFMASLDADDSMLSSAPVAAFGFLKGANGRIDVNGSLRSAPGTPLSVIGSKVTIHDGATLEALDSQISLTGARVPGELTPAIPSSIKGGLTKVAEGNSPGTVVIRGGRLVVENAAVDVSNTGGDLKVQLSDSLEIINGGKLTTASSQDNKGGNIVIEAPNVLMDSHDGRLATRVAAETASDTLGGGDVIIRSESVVVQHGAEISVSTFGEADAGRVDITTSLMRLEGSPASVTQISANAAPVSGVQFGSGGEIVIHATRLEVTKNATITASTLGDANAGFIDLKARSMIVQDSSITAYSSGAGNGGGIKVQADDLSLEGQFGSITALAIGVNSVLPAGTGGNIEIAARTLQLRNDAAISASTYGDGNAGNIYITANSLELDTGHPRPGIFPGISSTSSKSFDGTPNSGKGGDIFIKADSLNVHNQMLISVATATPGSGGNINIQANSVNVDGAGSIQSSSDGPGHAGTVTLRATGDVNLSAGGGISTSAPYSSAGPITVESGGSVHLTDSQITAQAGPGGGGDIHVEARDMVYLLRGALDAQAIGDGGNLSIVGPHFVVLDRSGMISKSDSANGGNITILSDYFLTSATTIDASAPFGLPGSVLIFAPNVDLSGSLVALPGNFLPLEAQLRPDCAVRLTGDLSSFIVLGRGGLPFEPGQLAPSSMAPAREQAP